MFHSRSLKTFRSMKRHSSNAHHLKPVLRIAIRFGNCLPSSPNVISVNLVNRIRCIENITFQSVNTLAMSFEKVKGPELKSN